MPTDHADHELIRATARVARVGGIALAVCRTCRLVLNEWPTGTPPAESTGVALPAEREAQR